MIKINKKECPVELTSDLKESLTEEFINSGKSVWKKDFIERALLESSYNKCCYCECKIDRESKYMEIEHYHDKHSNPHLVVEWDNLLPSCKRCNGHKSTYDTVKNPFINPAKINPKEHIIVSSYRFYPKTLAGKNTIDQLLLNDSKRLVLPRFEITDALLTQIDELYERTLEYNNGTRRTNQNKNKILSTLENLISEGMPYSEYSGTVATELANNVNFTNIIQIIKSEGLWTNNLNDLFYKMVNNTLDTDLSMVLQLMENAI